MKKKNPSLYFMILLLAVLSSAVLTSCIVVKAPDSDDRDDKEVMEWDSDEEEEQDEGQQNNDVDSPAGNEDNREGADDVPNSELTMQEAEDLINPLTQWAGLYMMGMLDREDELNDVLKSQIAAVTTAYGYLPEISEGNASVEINDNYYLYVSQEELRSAVKWLFVEPADVLTLPLPEETEGFCAGDGEGGALVGAGDWGLAAPRGNIVTIDNQGGILNLVTVSYVLYDYEIGGAIEELGIIEYLVQGTKEFGGPPKILNMTIMIARGDQSLLQPENWDEPISWESDDYSLTLPESWFGRFNAYQLNENTYTFAALNCQEENYTGTLFSITALPAGEEIEFPSFEILGEKDGMTYIATFPTDVEFDPENEISAAEYFDMYDYVESILSTFYFKE